MTDPIRDELHRLSEEFRKLVSGFDSTLAFEKTTPEQLVQCFGLTIQEAKAWLAREPDYNPSDVSYHGKKSDDKLPVPQQRMLISQDSM